MIVVSGKIKITRELCTMKKIHSLILLFLVFTFNVLAQDGDSLVAVFEKGPDLPENRMECHTVLLPDGNVGLFGGHGTGFSALKSAVIYDVEGDSFISLQMLFSHSWPAFTKMNDGKFLIAGGSANLGVPRYATSEIFDPLTSTFTATDDMHRFRSGTGAATLKDGKVLIASAWWTHNDAHTFGELFDPEYNSYKRIGPFAESRAHAIIIPTNDGHGVVMGGTKERGGNHDLPIENYDPVNDSIYTLQDNLIKDEPGWMITSKQTNAYQQQVKDGRYLFLFRKIEGNLTHYKLAYFDPETKMTSFFETDDLLPNSSSFSFSFQPFIDIDRDRAHLLATRSGTTQVAVFSVNLTTGQMIQSKNDYDPEYHISGSGVSLLEDGRLFVAGGSVSNNFDPVVETFFITPPDQFEEIEDSTIFVNKPTLTDITVYPNPFENTLHIHSNGNQIKDITIHDVSGSIICVYGNEERIKTEYLSSGIYIISITTENGEIQHKKIIKQ
jgi:hypothetical protein